MKRERGKWSRGRKEGEKKRKKVKFHQKLTWIHVCLRLTDENHIFTILKYFADDV